MTAVCEDDLCMLPTDYSAAEHGPAWLVILRSSVVIPRPPADVHDGGVALAKHHGVCFFAISLLDMKHDTYDGDIRARVLGGGTVQRSHL